MFLAAALVLSLSPAHALTAPPRGFPRSFFVSGNPATGEATGRGVLLHAQWFNDAGEPQKYFLQEPRMPWPRAVPVAKASFRIRLDGVRYPGDLTLGVFRRTGPRAAPMGRHAIYSCAFDDLAPPPCRWVPYVAAGRQGWEVQVDHEQAAGHLYIVAVGTWDDPRDPPRPVGTRSQIATWIYHARIRR